jgi:translation initiation factor 1 (eIF-1/SUI1)
VPSITITIEARMGNKVVTHIKGLEIFRVDLTSMVKDCQKKFACSASVGIIPGTLKHLYIYKYVYINVYTGIHICIHINIHIYVYTISGMIHDKEIVIQGHLALEVEVYLSDTWSIPKTYITSNILKGVKAKKK